MAIQAIAPAVSGVISGASSLGRASSGNQMGYGIGSKILGPAGDPAGSIYQMLLSKRQRDEEKKRFDEQMALEKQKIAIANKELNLTRNRDEMSNGQFGLGFLAQQRAGAQQNYRGKFLNDMSTALR